MEIKVKGQKLGIIQASNTLEQVCQMTAQNWSFFFKDYASHCGSYKAEGSLER